MILHFTPLGWWRWMRTGLTPERNARRNIPAFRPATYTFRVIACNNGGVWNETGVSLAFTVLPYFWQTLWFRVLGLSGTVLFTSGGVWYGTRRRMRCKLEILERQRAVERERTRISLLSQSARRGMDDVPQTEKNLDQICTTARQLTRAMDEIVWAVDPQHDTLDSLASYLGKLIHELLSDSGIRCEIQSAPGHGTQVNFVLPAKKNTP